MRLCLCLLLLLWTPHTEAKAADLSCKDDHNEDVDWYILYKAPGGQRYIYISTNKEEKSNKVISARDGALANTLRDMLKDKKDMANSFGFMSYNDQPPDGKSVSPKYGHSKGVLLMDTETRTGLWITHSTPQFPGKRNLDDFWPKSGNKNGQTFMCVTLNFNQLQVIATHLKFINPYRFDKRQPKSFLSELVYDDNTEDRKASDSDDPHFQRLMVGDKELLVVAKGIGQTAEDGDLYVQLSREFQSDVDAKTWFQQGQDKSYCEKNQYKVMNVISVQTGLGTSKWTTDHSKWAVTTDNNRHWTCIADMNRADPQYKRPGGALCIRDEKITNIFRGFVEERLQCRKRPSPCDESDEMEDLSESLEEMNLNEREDVIMIQSLQQPHIIMKPNRSEPALKQG